MSDVATPISTPISVTIEQLGRVTFNEAGLVPAIVQEEHTGRILMMAWMNADSLRETMATGRTWFWSRSRQEYWCKGETSGDRQHVREGIRPRRRLITWSRPIAGSSGGLPAATPWFPCGGSSWPT